MDVAELNLHEAETLPKLLSSARRFAGDNHLVSASYRLVPAFHSQLSDSAILFHFGFPAGWVDLYDDDSEFRQHDPIAEYVVKAGRLMTWQEAIDAQDLTGAQAGFVEKMHSFGLVHGYAMPCYGPAGREAYATFSFGRDTAMQDADKVKRCRDLMMAFHQAILRLDDERRDDPPSVSKREAEVLRWIARGKSNSEIATILGVSQSTVDTFVRRLFQKLGVNDRMAATFQGLYRGIIRL